MSQIPRLFVAGPLAGGAEVRVEGNQAHYLAHVLRLSPGSPVDLLDDISGEWRAEVVQVAKRHVTLAIRRHSRPREQAPDVWLCVAPLRRQRFEWVMEKATELGVRRVQPVLTRRTIADRINHDRLRAHMIEAAEQCERTALPELAEPLPLTAMLAGWDAGRALLFADEAGGESMRNLSPACPAAILIGPEGGFDASEREALLRLPAARRLSLGPRILRADTAAVAALAQFQLVVEG